MLCAHSLRKPIQKVEMWLNCLASLQFAIHIFEWFDYSLSEVDEQSGKDKGEYY